MCQVEAPASAQTIHSDVCKQQHGLLCQLLCGMSKATLKLPSSLQKVIISATSEWPGS